MAIQCKFPSSLPACVAARIPSLQSTDHVSGYQAVWGNCKEQLNDGCLPGVKHPGIVGQLALKYQPPEETQLGLACACACAHPSAGAWGGHTVGAQKVLVHRDEPAWQNQNSGPGSSSTAVPSKVLSDLTSQMLSLQYPQEAKGLSLSQYLCASGRKA